MIEEVFSYAVDNEMEEFVFFVEEQGHGEVAYLLLRVLARRYQVHGFEVSEVDIPS